ncbi:hypothetical protein HYH03_003908 [Edaphochlamys debaryana]|uniref:Patatin n=1 Tax=Edaphochlamys debaryana TaxID=47281 RepID=A0A835Y8C0_9CHLO|nr:hypothetical protein HYH03_003908 [Edaphochlamys debaryana]|eukprot:KAG2498150.1 hypothetical protein HYH03_003908 [Edaphochlamys debaryana]
MAPVKDVKDKDSKALALAKAAEEQSAAELLAYYKSRVEGFEAERAELLARLDQCAVQGSEMHVLEWEARKRAEEVRELQKALSDAHNFLFDERQRLLALQAENDDLRLQEIQDRKNIQQLLSLQQGGLPGRPGGPGAGLPGPNVDHLLLQIESLHAQLNEQKQLATERIAALLEDRRIREQEEEAHRRSLSTQLEAATERLQRQEEQLRTTTKDYILARRERQSAEERALEAQAMLASERQSFMEQATEQRRRAAAELSGAREEAEAKLEDVASILRSQLKAKEEDLVNLSSVHNTAVAQYDRRIAELELKVARLAESNKQLELRRHLDCEGWTADVTALRKTLGAVDRKLHEMRLVERLEDDDRLDAILAHLRKKAPNVPLPGPGPSAGAGSGLPNDGLSVKSALAEGLRDVRVQVRELESRLAERQKQKPAGAGAAAGAGAGPGHKGKAGARSASASRPALVAPRSAVAQSAMQLGRAAQTGLAFGASLIRRPRNVLAAAHRRPTPSQAFGRGSRDDDPQPSGRPWFTPPLLGLSSSFSTTPGQSFDGEDTRSGTDGDSQQSSDERSTRAASRLEQVKRGLAEGTLGFGFSAGGFLYPYHLGVLWELRDLNILKDYKVQMAGASAGSLAVATYNCGLEPEKAMQALHEFAANCRSNGTRYRLGGLLRDFLHAYLPKDAHERCRGNTYVALTRLFPVVRNEMVSEWSSKDDFVNSLLTSCHIPFYFNGSWMTEYRGKFYMDGGVAAFVPRPPTEYAVKVCCFPVNEVLATVQDRVSQYERVASLLDVAISPDAYEPWPFNYPQMVTWALVPADDDMLRYMVNKGRKDGRAWAQRMQLVPEDAAAGRSGGEGAGSLSGAEGAEEQVREAQDKVERGEAEAGLRGSPVAAPASDKGAPVGSGRGRQG